MFERCFLIHAPDISSVLRDTKCETLCVFTFFQDQRRSSLSFLLAESDDDEWSESMATRPLKITRPNADSGLPKKNICRYRFMFQAVISNTSNREGWNITSHNYETLKSHGREGYNCISVKWAFYLLFANFVTIRDNYFIRRGDDFSLGILGEFNALYIV